VPVRRIHEAEHAQRRALTIASWRDLGYSKDTSEGYLQWVERYRAWCRARRLDEIRQLTRRCVDRFARLYAKTRRVNVRRTIFAARPALHTWARALARLGHPVPPWVPPRVGPFEEVMAPYREFRRRWRGVAESSLCTECGWLTRFLEWLRRHHRRLASLSATDIEKFLVEISAHLTTKTMAGLCSALRAFLRFLHATGSIAIDVSRSWVMAPKVRRSSQPPRTRPWREVCRILSVIDRDSALGKRDYAALLLMAAYGMGAGEALSLQLEDVDWHGASLRLTRPKTGVAVMLPLLGPVGRALASYLRHGRPRGAKTRALFVRARAPHPPLRVRELGKRFRAYAQAAGIAAERLGTHVLRHCHATREVEMAAPPKVVSDILGHDDPNSLSTYVRVATERLREVSLPVPR
jgi:site-specific recombinase XerD